MEVCPRVGCSTTTLGSMTLRSVEVVLFGTRLTTPCAPCQLGSSTACQEAPPSIDSRLLARARAAVAGPVTRTP